MDAAGDFVVAWESFSPGQDGSGEGVYAQRFGSAGQVYRNACIARTNN